MKATALAVSVVAAGAACSASEPELSKETITLLEAGRAPHRAVTYRPTRAHTTKGAVRDSMHFTVDWKLLSARDGKAKYRFQITEAGMAPPAGELANMGAEEAAVQQQVFAMVRKLGKGVVVGDAQGRVGAAHDSAIAHVSPSIPDLAELMVVPLPTEPIGVGARWRVQGARWADAVVDLEYEARELSAEGVTVTLQGGSEQDAMRTALTGEIAARFDDLVPQRGTLTTVIRVPGIEPEITTEMELR
jgi:hypothetical protein